VSFVFVAKPREAVSSFFPALCISPQSFPSGNICCNGLFPQACLQFLQDWKIWRVLFSGFLVPSLSHRPPIFCSWETTPSTSWYSHVFLMWDPPLLHPLFRSFLFPIWSSFFFPLSCLFFDLLEPPFLSSAGPPGFSQGKLFPHRGLISAALGTVPLKSRLERRTGVFGPFAECSRFDRSKRMPFSPPLVKAFSSFPRAPFEPSFSFFLRSLS